jgi:hypothetical protein
MNSISSAVRNPRRVSGTVSTIIAHVIEVSSAVTMISATRFIIFSRLSLLSGEEA